MISKNRIAGLRKLHLKKFRDESRLFIVEGRKSVEMLLHSSFVIQELFATEAFASQYVSLLHGRPVSIGSPSELERMSALSTSPEILAVVQQPDHTAPISDNEPIIALDRIADPGNLGTIVRTADWFGIRQVVCSPDCVEFYNPKTIQATMGSFCHVNVGRRDLPDFLREQQSHRRILGAFLGGEDVRTFTFQPADLLVIGSESHGISPAVAECVTHKITISCGVQGTATAESLNAAVAAAILMFRMK